MIDTSKVPSIPRTSKIPRILQFLSSIFFVIHYQNFWTFQASDIRMVADIRYQVLFFSSGALIHTTAFRCCFLKQKWWFGISFVTKPRFDKQNVAKTDGFTTCSTNFAVAAASVVGAPPFYSHSYFSFGNIVKQTALETLYVGAEATKCEAASINL